jgi:hypothetical protein
MLIQKTHELILYFKHDGRTLELDQEVISSVGLIELLKKDIKITYPKIKSFGLSLIAENVFEVQISILGDLNWKF